MTEATDNPVIFVGAGPGDPDLITVKGQRALQEADLVVYAGSLVPEALLTWAQKAESVNSASRHLDEIVDLMVTAVKSGKRVVRLHTGDPSLYGAVFEQMVELEQQNIVCRMVPGVTAAFAAAAALGLEYTLPEITQTLILTRLSGRTRVPEAENLRDLAAHRASLAIYLSIGLVDEVQDILAAAYGEDHPCIIAARVSQPEERLFRVPVRELAAAVYQNNIKRQAMIVISPTLAAAGRNQSHKSKLYDKHFSHQYRA